MKCLATLRTPGELAASKQTVLIHEWPQDAIAQAVPYCVYEITFNHYFP